MHLLLKCVPLIQEGCPLCMYMYIDILCHLFSQMYDVNLMRSHMEDKYCISNDSDSVNLCVNRIYYIARFCFWSIGVFGQWERLTRCTGVLSGGAFTPLGLIDISTMPPN